jgi:cyclophilin family peptidyl-prolyl cis-trans isomerase
VSRPRTLALALAALLALLSLGVLVGCGDDGGTSAATATSTTADEGPCRAVDLPAPKGEQNLPKPKLKLDPSRRYTAKVTTNCGSFTIALDVKRAPKTTASFVSLARQGFYDDLVFHRVAPGFVIQGGDPLGNGSGGPGYSVVEAPPSNLQYFHGVVAMAKTATEADGTSGSQFFVVTAQDAALPPQYALLGKVSEGLEIADTIGVQPIDQASSVPIDPIVIESVEIQES